MNPAPALLAHLRDQRPALIDWLRQLVLIETPSSAPERQAPAFGLLAEALAELGFRVERRPGEKTGGHLLARPRDERPSDWRSPAPRQLLLGHVDTVWPAGTLADMPVEIRDGIMTGPGIFDMKAGLAMIIFALRALRDLALTPTVTPVVFVNSDEEIGSVESRPFLTALAQEARRVWVLEPALGRDGRLKTARKGVGQYELVVTGRAAHAGLDPEKGVSAILELAHLIQDLFALNDPARGVSVNAGVIRGGLRPNVIAPEATAVVDVRVPAAADAARIDAALHALKPRHPDAHLAISGGLERPPLERTPANQALWQQARTLGQALGLELAEGIAGGGSDGNITSQFAATLDGLGAVGDGAHARHEHILLDRLPERTALLALLLLADG